MPVTKCCTSFLGGPNARFQLTFEAIYILCQIIQFAGREWPLNKSVQREKF